MNYDKTEFDFQPLADHLSLVPWLCAARLQWNPFMCMISFNHCQFSFQAESHSAFSAILSEQSIRQWCSEVVPTSEVFPKVFGHAIPRVDDGIIHHTISELSTLILRRRQGAAQIG